MHRRFAVDRLATATSSLREAVGPPPRAQQRAVVEPVPQAVPQPSSSTTCGSASGRTCTASCARSPASSASAPGSEAGHPDRVHQALLAGLLSHIGMRDGTADTRAVTTAARTARSSRSARLGAVAKHRRSGSWRPNWSRPTGCGRARGQRPARVGRSASASTRQAVVRRATWDARSGRAVTTERVTLYGLPIVASRTRRLRPGRPVDGAEDVHPPRAGRGRLDRPTPSSSTTARSSISCAPARTAPASSTRRRRRGVRLLRPARRTGRRVDSPLRPVVEARSQHRTRAA